MDIQMRKDGSSKVILEYHISRMAEVIGRLDGNQKWPIVPIGRADWERTAQRIPTMKIVSFSSRENSREAVTNVTLEFDNTEALLKFLDPSGERSSLDAGRLQLILSDPVLPEINDDLVELVQQVSAGYKFSISFTAEGNPSSLTITDNKGKEIPPPTDSEIIPSGRKVSLSIPTAEILNNKNGLGVRFNW